VLTGAVRRASAIQGSAPDGTGGSATALSCTRTAHRPDHAALPSGQGRRGADRARRWIARSP